MMSGSIFYQIHLTLTDVMRTSHTNKIFGDVSIILVGDLNQLQPIGSYIFELPKINPLANAVENFLWKDFQLYELTQIMRQRDDKLFGEALSRLATGNLTENNIVLFKSRVFKEKDLDAEGKKAIRLVATNDQTELFNNIRMCHESSNCSYDITYKAKDDFIGQITGRQKEQAIHSLSLLKPKDTQGMLSTIRLMTGIKYMVTVNIDVESFLSRTKALILKMQVVHVIVFHVITFVNILL